MKEINEMSYEELVEEIKYIVSLLDDQPHHHDAYLADLTAALVAKTTEFYASL